MSVVEQVVSRVQELRSNVREAVEKVRPKVIFSEDLIERRPRLKIIETLREQGYRPGILIETALTRIKEIRERLKLGEEKHVMPIRPPPPSKVKAQAGMTRIVGEEIPSYIYTESETVASQATEEVPVETEQVQVVEEKKKSFFY